MILAIPRGDPGQRLMLSIVVQQGPPLVAVLRASEWPRLPPSQIPHSVEQKEIFYSLRLGMFALC